MQGAYYFNADQDPVTRKAKFLHENILKLDYRLKTYWYLPRYKSLFKGKKAG
jgi:hypothetical protein